MRSLAACIALFYGLIATLWLAPTGLVGAAFVPTTFPTVGVPQQQRSIRKNRRTKLFAEEGPPEERQNKNPFDFILNPYESKIPKDIEKEIYDAEANTAAAQDRGKRVASYAALAFVGILFAFFNAFLTGLRHPPEDAEVQTAIDLTQAGFGWVESNFLTSFLFLNKIGGLLCLLGGAGAGLLAEAELDTRRINAEKIFEELQRRRSKKLNKTRPRKSAKKRRSGKEAKRLDALSEVVADAEPAVAVVEETVDVPVVEEKQEPEPKEEKKDGGGLLDTVKGFYEKADQMAASQALLLNKELEDRGIVEKITDETGLKVVGKEDVAKVKDEGEAKANE